MPFTIRRTKHRTFELDLPITNTYTHEVLMSAIHESLSLAELLEISAEIKILDRDHFDICTVLAAGLLNDGMRVFTTLQLSVKTDEAVDDDEIRLALEVAFQTYCSVVCPTHPFEVKAYNMGRPITQRCALFDMEKKTVDLFAKPIEFVTPPVSPIPPRHTHKLKQKRQRICMGF